MAFNGSGVFQRVMDWTNDAAAHIKIQATRHDQNDDDIASGLSNTICRDGQSQVTQDIPWNGKKITGLANPTGAQDAATKGYSDLKAPVASPTFTGKVTLPTGAAGSAPLAFPAGVAPTTPVDGDVWAGANTAVAGAIRQRILGVTYSYARLELDQNFTARLAVGSALTIPANSRSALTLAGEISFVAGYSLGWNAYWDNVAAGWKSAASGWGALINVNPVNGLFSVQRSTASAGAADAVLTMAQLMAFDAAGTLIVNGNIQSQPAGNFIGNTGGGVVLSPGVSGTIFLRPVGVGSATAQCTVNNSGDLVSAGNVSAYSDPRLKDDVEPIEFALEIIKQLDGVRFTWNNRSKAVGRPGKRDIGVLSNQVEAVLPEIVGLSTPHEDEGGEQWQTVAYDKLTPVLIEAVKQLARRVEQLEERV